MSKVKELMMAHLESEQKTTPILEILESIQNLKHHGYCGWAHEKNGNQGCDEVLVRQVSLSCAHNIKRIPLFFRAIAALKMLQIISMDEAESMCKIVLDTEDRLDKVDRIVEGIRNADSLPERALERTCLYIGQATQRVLQMSAREREELLQNLHRAVLTPLENLRDRLVNSLLSYCKDLGYVQQPQRLPIIGQSRLQLHPASI